MYEGHQMDFSINQKPLFLELVLILFNLEIGLQFFYLHSWQ